MSAYLGKVNERLRRHYPAGDDGLDPYGWPAADRCRDALDNPEDYPEIWVDRWEQMTPAEQRAYRDAVAEVS